MDPARPTLVGFFSPGCAPCSERIPDFVSFSGTGVATLAVVTDGDDTGPYVARLSDVDVTVQPADGAWVTGFAVTSYPTFCLVGADGVVLGSGNALTDLPLAATPVPAAR